MILIEEELEQGSITGDGFYEPPCPWSGASDLLVLWRDPHHVEAEREWFEAIDAMLGWVNEQSWSQIDAPRVDVLRAAIDFAKDMQSTSSIGAPNTIMPTEGGTITMEWSDGHTTVALEFFGEGRSRFTRFIDGRIDSEGVLFRNPKTRRLELQRA